MSEQEAGLDQHASNPREVGRGTLEALEAVARRWFSKPGFSWVGLGWVGLGWVGLGWVGLGWVRSDLDLFKRHLLDRLGELLPNTTLAPTQSTTNLDLFERHLLDRLGEHHRLLLRAHQPQRAKVDGREVRRGGDGYALGPEYALDS